MNVLTNGNNQELPELQQEEKKYYLLPCPFCGNTTHLGILADEQETEEGELITYFHVVCSAIGFDDKESTRGCGASSGKYLSADDTVSMWNARYGRPNDMLNKMEQEKEEEII